MKSAPQTHRIIRVSPALHREAKALAAAEGKTLEQMAGEALTEALERRQLAGDDILRATLSKPLPIQTRG